MRLTKGEPDPDGNRDFNQLPEYLLGATPFLLATALNDTDTMLALVEGRRGHLRFRWRTARRRSWRRWAIFPGVFTFIPFVKIPPGGAAGDNTAYFQRKKLFTEAKVLETMKLVVELGGDINAARGNLVTYHVGNSRTLVGRDAGDTALHIATVDKYPTVVEFLVSKGAKLDVEGPARAHAAGDRRSTPGGSSSPAATTARRSATRRWWRCSRSSARRNRQGREHRATGIEQEAEGKA